MAKDPAILWYWNDYLSGTEAYTWEQQGAYMRLLCHQMDKGHLSEQFIRGILKGDYAAIWAVIHEKFDIDEEGNFFNHRVDEEKQKRANYLEKQHQNGKKGGRPKKNPEKTHGFALGSTWVNPNGNPKESTRVENENIDSKRESLEDKVDSSVSSSEVSLLPAESSITGVRVESTKSKKEKAKTFKTLTREEFLHEVACYGERYPPPMLEDFIRYWSEPDERGRMRFQKQDTWSTPGRLVTWNNNNKNKFYGSHQQTPAPGTPDKPGTSRARIEAARKW